MCTATGPYSEPVMVYNGSDRAVPLPSNGSSPLSGATGDTNLAAVILEDGSLVGIWRGSQYPNTSQWQYTVRASDWKELATYSWGSATVSNNIFPTLQNGGLESRNCGVEDPTLWLDDDGIIHALFHNWRAGAHAASGDNGVSWHWYGGNCSATTGPDSIDWSRSAWPQNVTFVAPPEVAGSSGSNSVRAGVFSRQVHRRERPHILTNSAGNPMALSTACQLDGPPHDITWTMVQSIKT